jgi:hypothetical protein
MKSYGNFDVNEFLEVPLSNPNGFAFYDSTANLVEDDYVHVFNSVEHNDRMR